MNPVEDDPVTKNRYHYGDEKMLQEIGSQIIELDGDTLSEAFRLQSNSLGKDEVSSHTTHRRYPT
jgi:hypothetical protein